MTVAADTIARLLNPRSVALIGASDKPGALATTIMDNLRRAAYKGDLHPINPKRDTIGGQVCLKSLDDLPLHVDVAILAIPKAGVLDAVRGLAARKVGAAIIFSAGFAEDGEAGMAQQQEIARVAQDAGMILLGPNCLGLVNHVQAVPLTFVETQIRTPSARAFSIVSQSGAIAAVLCTTLMARALDCAYSISTGNEALSGVEDYAEWLVDDASTQVIALVVEQFRKPARFMAVAERAALAGKPLILLHPGKSTAARASAATHTGALAGDYALMRVKLERLGVCFAESLQELGDLVEIRLRCPKLMGSEVAVLGESGAYKALALDLAESLGLALAPLNNGNAPALRQALPAFVPVSNPLDITAQGLSTPSIYTDTLTALLEDDRVGAILAGIILSDPKTCAIKLPAILKACEKPLNKPFIFAGLDEGADMPQDYITQLRQAGVPYFPTAERALTALARLANQPSAEQNSRSAQTLTFKLHDALSGTVPEYLTKQALAPLGISFPQGQFASNVTQAIEAAETLGYPLAMKAQAAALSHKSDAGGVALNLHSREEVEQAWHKMHTDVKAYDASISLDGVLLEKMGARGLELIVGAKRDVEWGVVVLAGFGGVTAEILADICLITPDMNESEILTKLNGLKQAPLLHGYRGAPALDTMALAHLIRTCAALMEAEPRIQELDLNPVILYPQGQGVVALDALMQMS
jgi:acetate---CoA ligase (ADP-forming)